MGAYPPFPVHKINQWWVSVRFDTSRLRTKKHKTSLSQNISAYPKMGWFPTTNNRNIEIKEISPLLISGEGGSRWFCREKRSTEYRIIQKSAPKCTYKMKVYRRKNGCSLQNRKQEQSKLSSKGFLQNRFAFCSGIGVFCCHGPWAPILKMCASSAAQGGGGRFKDRKL